MTKLTSSFIGDSPAIHRLRQLAVRLADAPFPIVIEGETGTGKFELALLIHQKSSRRREPFVDVHCAALPETLFESMIFGHERGAFTDARERHLGRIDAAAGGTLLFDEVDCLSVTQQAKLLRILDRGRYERVGGRDTLTVSASLLFATNRNLPELVASGAFRNDLYQRIGALTLTIPPLRERPEDIELLAALFLQDARSSYGLSAVRWDATSMRLLLEYAWPGNTRELKSTVTVVSYLHTRGEVIAPEEILTVMKMRHQTARSAVGPPTLVGVRTDAERRVIAETLRLTSGNRAQAARLLKIGRRTLHEKMSRYGL